MAGEKGGSGGNSGGGGGSRPQIFEGGPDEKLQNVFDLVSEIQQFAAMDSADSVIPEGYFTYKNQIDHYMVGFSNTLKHGIFSALTMPLVVAVFEKHAPVFGGEPTMFDKMIVGFITLVLGFTMAILVASIGKYYTGSGYIKAMIRSVVSGVATAYFLKGVLAFAFYNFLALYVMSDARMIRFFAWLGKYIDHELLKRLFLAANDFRDVLIPAGWYTALMGFAAMALPWATIAWKIIQDKKAEARKS